MTPYIDRLRAAVAQRGALCVGVDPHPGVLDRWGLPDTAAGVERLARGLIAAIGDRVACFKPQSAFFEAHGSAGVAVLERVIADAHDAGALVIVDAKRGDVGSTMAAYARAYLGSGPLVGDAVTLSPYLGLGALDPAFDLAEGNGKGVYVLARTSNPEGHAVQLATTEAGPSVVQSIVDQAAARNLASGLQAVGLVVGATHADAGADLAGFAGSILVPGVGAQGGTMDGVKALFGDTAATVLPSVSRAILWAGPEPEALQTELDHLLTGS
ncbi:MAG: orotidine-5'-phosphate decarboxylase [Propionibacteriaceae bacterium]|jgi:orotidine-5'-phosphate decarboxylase|nr:orotidine-5'-phosphate decarboxylase [Propionibacteriaceae bacterium]